MQEITFSHKEVKPEHLTNTISQNEFFLELSLRRSDFLIFPPMKSVESKAERLISQNTFSTKLLLQYIFNF